MRLGLSFLVVLGAASAAAAKPVARGVETTPNPILSGKGKAQVFFGQHTDSPDAALTLLTLDKGAVVPEHVHEHAVELLYVLEGKTELKIGTDAPVTLGPGDAVRVPMNTPHSAKVLGDVPLKAVQVYTPSGPEQRFLPAPVQGPRVTVTLETVAVKGPFKPDELVKALSGQTDELRLCHEAGAIEANAGMRGRAVATVTLGNDGTVRKAVVQGVSPGRLTECLNRAVSRMKFPAPPTAKADARIGWSYVADVPLVTPSPPAPK